jgi:hypothetical protein
MPSRPVGGKVGRCSQRLAGSAINPALKRGRYMSRFGSPAELPRNCAATAWKQNGEAHRPAGAFLFIPPSHGARAPCMVPRRPPRLLHTVRCGDPPKLPALSCHQWRPTEYRNSAELVLLLLHGCRHGRRLVRSECVSPCRPGDGQLALAASPHVLVGFSECSCANGFGLDQICTQVPPRRARPSALLQR